MGQLIDGFFEYRSQKEQKQECRTCNNNFQGFCQVQVPARGSEEYKWVENAVTIVMARQLDWTVERFQQYLKDNAQDVSGVIQQSTNRDGTIVLKAHDEINAEKNCPFFGLNTALQKSLLEDIVDYAKTLKFSFK